MQTISLNNCTLLNANYNYLPQLDNTDFDTHGTVKCGCVEDSGVGVSQTVMSDEGTNYCPRHNHTVQDTTTPSETHPHPHADSLVS
jgi:hypothetical protein